MLETWKSVSEPYWREDLKWVIIDYEMQNPDDMSFLPPDYPYRYFYRGEPWISGICKTVGGGQMSKDGVLTGRVLFAGAVGDEVTLKLAKIDRDNVGVVHSYPDEVTKTIPEKVVPDDAKFPVKETILYGASAAGLFIAGTAVKSMVPKYTWAGWILQIATVIPVGMLGRLLYNYFKEFETPFGTEELEELAQQ